MMRTFIALISVLPLLLCCSKPRPTQFGTSANNSPVPVLQEPVPGEILDTVGLKTYLALGDSYTFGQSVPDNQRLPVQVSAQLNGLGVKVSAPEIIARTGWTTRNLLDKLNNEPPLLSSYNIVTLLIGVNNQYQGRSQDEYRHEFETLLDKAIGYAGNISSRVFVLSIPDWSVMPFANGSDKNLISQQIDSFNVINKEVSLQKKVRYTDIVDLSRQAAYNPLLIANDGLHPSGTQYRMWANRLVPTIRVLFY